MTTTDASSGEARGEEEGSYRKATSEIFFHTRTWMGTKGLFEDLFSTPRRMGHRRSSYLVCGNSLCDNSSSMRRVLMAVYPGRALCSFLFVVPCSFPGIIQSQKIFRVGINISGISILQPHRQPCQLSSGFFAFSKCGMYLNSSMRAQKSGSWLKGYGCQLMPFGASGEDIGGIRLQFENAHYP